MYLLRFPYLYIMIWRFIAFLIICTSCANIKGIEGGKEDKTAPKIVLSKSSPNQQTNFRPKEIKLNFNEWIALQNPTQNVIVSPSVNYPIKFRLKGKTVHLEFDKREVLKDSTTYSISFGNAIEDITGKNKASNIKFVFSTGSYIDSLSLHGFVLDAFTKEPVEKAVVVLYEENSDTAFTTKKPNYISFCDKKGAFSFSNVKAANFSIYAITDNNQNYYYDQKTESIAFLEHTVNPFMDTLKSIVLIHSKELLPLKIISIKEMDGHTRILFNQKPNKFQVIDLENNSIPTLISKDTLFVYNMTHEKQTAIVQYEEKNDTLHIPLPKINSKRSNRLVAENTLLKPFQKLMLQAKIPILSFDRNLIHTSFTSQENTIKINPLNPHQLVIEVPKSDRREYVLLDSLAIRFQDSSTHRMDTFFYSQMLEENLTNVELTIDSLKDQMQYIVQLVKENSVIEEKIVLAEKNQCKVEFIHVIPGKYRVKLIEDQNKNGRWDPVQWDKKVLPEKVILWDIQELRADWKLKLELKP